MSVEWQGDHRLLTDEKVAFERELKRLGLDPWRGAASLTTLSELTHLARHGTRSSSPTWLIPNTRRASSTAGIARIGSGSTGRS
jgi:hypothetical protein